jgi:hypothetical protein
MEAVEEVPSVRVFTESFSRRIWFAVEKWATARGKTVVGIIPLRYDGPNERFHVTLSDAPPWYVVYVECWNDRTEARVVSSSPVDVAEPVEPLGSPFTAPANSLSASTAVGSEPEGNGKSEDEEIKRLLLLAGREGNRAQWEAEISELKLIAERSSELRAAIEGRASETFKRLAGVEVPKRLAARRAIAGHVAGLAEAICDYIESLR